MYSSILVIVTRRIGDVFLTTPMIHSLRHAYPDAQLEVLVYNNTDGIIAGNPDIDRIISIPEHPGKKEYLKIIGGLFRKYDLVVATQGTDRAMLYALFAGKKKRLGIIQSMRTQEIWKRWLLDQWILLDNVNTHTVIQNLKLMDLLKIPRHCRQVPPRAGDAAIRHFCQSLPFSIDDSPYVVLHPFPKYRYKEWQFDGWSDLIRYLLTTNKNILLSGGPGQEEVEYCRKLVSNANSNKLVSIAGQTSLCILAELLKKADVYVGPDTAVTHLAAATGTRTITFYGPSNPMKWGPWPINCELDEGSPFMNKQLQQEVDNVVILQGEGECVPCYEEGCDRHRESRSRCLQNLQVQRIIDEFKQL